MAPVQLVAVKPPVKPTSETKGGTSGPPALMATGGSSQALTSAGHAAVAPSHASTRSQGALAARQVAPSGLGWQSVPQHEPAAPLSAPASQISPLSTTPSPQRLCGP